MKKSKCFILVIILCIILVYYLYMNNKKLSNNSDSGSLDNDLINIYNQQQDNLEKEAVKPKSCEAAIPIFMYHFITDALGDYPYPENMVSPSKLEEQLKYLVENNYETIFINNIEDIYKYNKPIALTFDDGYLDFYLYAFPLMIKYNVKSTLFVINKYIGTPGYCTIEQLQQMQESGLVRVEAHTVSHDRLATLSNGKVKEELQGSKTYLSENLDINSTVICYPYGSYNNVVIEEAKKLYKYGLAMDGGVYYTNKDDLYEISRIYANRSMPMQTFINYCNKSNVNVEW